MFPLRHHHQIYKYEIVISKLHMNYIFYNKRKKSYEINRSFGGGKGIRTLDPLRARQVLSQLSYTPKNGGPSGTRTPDLPVMSRLL